MPMDFYLGIAVVVATLFGPVLAVLVTRIIDQKRDRRQRQLDVFRALMRSRRAALSAEYVSAFNTVEVEFAGVKAVENAQRDLLRHLGVQPQPPEWFDAFRRLQTRLLYAIAVHLKYKMEQLDVLESGYFPLGWGTTEEQQRALLQATNELVTGNRTLRVEVVPPQPALQQSKNVLPLKDQQAS
jgi:hypothetical protein